MGTTQQIFNKNLKKILLAGSMSLASFNLSAVQLELLEELGFTEAHEKGITGSVTVVVIDSPVLTEHKAFGGEAEEVYRSDLIYSRLELGTHGTQMASIIKANSSPENRDQGAAFDVTLKTIGYPVHMPVSTSKTNEEILDHIENLDNARLISMSLTPLSFDDAQLERFEDILVKKDCGIVIAAGNDAEILADYSSFRGAIEEEYSPVRGKRKAAIMASINFKRLFDRPKIRERLIIVGNASNLRETDKDEVGKMAKETTIDSESKTTEKSVEETVSLVAASREESELEFYDFALSEDKSEEDIQVLNEKDKMARDLHEGSQGKIRKKNAEELMSLLTEFLKENGLNFIDFISLKDQLAEDMTLRALEAFPEEEFETLYREKIKTGGSFLNAQEEKEWKERLRTDFNKKRLIFFRENFGTLFKQKMKELIERNERCQAIIKDLFLEGVKPKVIAKVLYSMAKSQVYSHNEATKETKRLKLDFSLSVGENCGEETFMEDTCFGTKRYTASGSNRAGFLQERFITTIGKDIQSASFKKSFDMETCKSFFEQTYEKSTGTSPATALVTSALSLILQQDATLTVPQAMEKLLSTAAPTDHPSSFGRGIMDLRAAMAGGLK
ncbi:MAG: hypothetical protein BGO67_07770 [Alphaproteobacteria bacterium 41-28]|nr:MAG: hypothetical protein BGO67_07770 [Alphaproteobacteria bacterium 41-28]